MNDLERRIKSIATVPILLVASDYDGTISPIVPDPSKAKPHREARVAVRLLSQLPQTHVAIISGRALRDVAAMADLPAAVHIVGSHGSEFDLDFATSLPEASRKLRDRVRDELKAIASDLSGATVEEKPASVAFHYRKAKDPDDAIRRVLEGPASLDGVFTKRGKKVVELSVVSTSKNVALDAIRHRVGASAVVYFGDDQTDEDAFATLKGPDVAIKVGDGETCAPYRVDGPAEVAKLLALLTEERQAWLAGSEAVAIEEHSMLSDQRTIALVTPSGRITWFCTPRIDSSALFAEIVGGPAAGYFSVCPADGSAPVEQHYLNDSLVLRTAWSNFSVTDFLDCSAGRPSNRPGRCELIRIIQGEGRIRIAFAPRHDFGRLETNLVAREEGIDVLGSPEPIVLRSPGVVWRIEKEGGGKTAHAEIELHGDAVALELRYGTASLRNSEMPAGERCHETRRYWAWSMRDVEAPGLAAEAVTRSALVLKGLYHKPTGAFAAAGSTSLPELIGGVRNWDYRYCWLRDGAMAARALVRLGSISESMKFLDWVLGIIDRCAQPERLHPLYTVDGRELAPEAELAELPGYRGSRPVRVGNRADHQVQLDVFGPIIDLVATLHDRDAPLSSEHWRLVTAMVRAAAERWREPDHGIWEIRRPARHHVHSKVMCWYAVERAVRIGRSFAHEEREDWAHLMNEIAEDVLAHGFKPALGAFTAAYDDVDLDAAALHVGLSGMLPPDDPRFVGTVDAVERGLLDGATVYRYRSDDGLPGSEGGFHLCTAWLIEAYVLMGRLDDARRLFADVLSLIGPTGLLSEQYSPDTGNALGNVPQTYSHVAIIETAVLLSQFE